MAKKKSKENVAGKPPAKARPPRVARAQAAAAVEMGGAVVAAAPPTPVIPIPIGVPVQLTIPFFGVDRQVLLDGVLVEPAGDIYNLTPLGAGNHPLMWVITPLSAPWSFVVTLIVGGQPQELDRGAGNSVSDPIVNTRILSVS
jgi:hypothetical protein